MAARFPILVVPSSRQLSSTPLHAIPQCFNLYSNPPRKRFTFCASAAKKPRASRKLMTDEELCNGIREFSSVHGLPRGQVPSMKELTTHGRKDLANIVRRRGYKLVEEILLKSFDMKAEEDSLDGQQLRPQIEIAEASIDEMLGQDENMPTEVGRDQLGSDMGFEKSQDMLSSVDTGPAFDNQIYTSSDSASTANLTFQEKVSNFIQKGGLDIFEDELQTVNETDHKKEELIKAESGTEISFSMGPKEDNENGSDEHNVTGPVNGWIPTITSSKAPAEQDNLRDVNLVPVKMSKSKEDLQVVMEGKDNQDEINHLKSELHQKEQELSKLKEQIEREKLSLFHLQAKAEAEISKALKLVAEKDTELSSVEEQLSGLKEVQIEYKGNGSTVEVAGSFNGWHHQIQMELQPSSTVHDSAESRKHRLWSTSLWLYPGVYEIKFIVDGHWTVDPHRESITRGAIHNNILRVER